MPATTAEEPEGASSVRHHPWGRWARLRVREAAKERFAARLGPMLRFSGCSAKREAKCLLELFRAWVGEGAAHMDARCWDTSASRAAAPSCAMELPSDDDGASPALLPSEDDGQMELPEFDVALLRDSRTLRAPRSSLRRGGGHCLRLALPSDDDGHTADTTLQLGLPRSLAGIAKRRRRGPAQQRRRGPRGDHPRDVISAPSAGTSLAAGGQGVIIHEMCTLAQVLGIIWRLETSTCLGRWRTTSSTTSS